MGKVWGCPCCPDWPKHCSSINLLQKHQWEGFWMNLLTGMNLGEERKSNCQKSVFKVNNQWNTFQAFVKYNCFITLNLNCYIFFITLNLNCYILSISKQNVLLSKGLRNETYVWNMKSENVFTPRPDDNGNCNADAN